MHDCDLHDVDHFERSTQESKKTVNNAHMFRVLLQLPLSPVSAAVSITQ